MAQKIYPNAFGGKYLSKFKSETYSCNQNKIILFKVNFLLKEFLKTYLKSKNILIINIFIKYPTQNSCQVFIKWFPIDSKNSYTFTNKNIINLTKKRNIHISGIIPRLKNISLSNQKIKPFIGKNKKHLNLIDNKLVRFLPVIPYKEFCFQILYISCYYGSPNIRADFITIQFEKTQKQNQIIESWRLLFFEFIEIQNKNKLVKGLEIHFLGRINNSDRSKKIKITEGNISYSTFKSDTRFSKSTVITKNGKISVSVTMNLNLNTSNKFLLDKNYNTIKRFNFNGYKLTQNTYFLSDKMNNSIYTTNQWNKTMSARNWDSFIPLENQLYKIVTLKNTFNN